MGVRSRNRAHWVQGPRVASTNAAGACRAWPFRFRPPWTESNCTTPITSPRVGNANVAPPSLTLKILSGVNLIDPHRLNVVVLVLANATLFASILIACLVYKS